MNANNYTRPWEDGEPVLVLHGGTPATRQILMRHLRSTSIGFRLVELPVESVSSDPDSESEDIIAFVREFGTRMSRLTKKERIVLGSILEGQTNKAISLKLDLTQRAIELRKASLMKKLNSHSHTELVCLITKYETLKKYLVRHVITEADELGVTGSDSFGMKRLEPAFEENL